MNWLLVSLGIMIIGILANQIWLAVTGIILVILSITRVSNPQHTVEPVLTHKLVQSPEVWEEDNFPIHQSMIMPIGLDVMAPINEKVGKELGGIPAGIIQRFSPWPNYGESSAIQQMMAGMILPLDNWLFNKTYEAKFRGKWGKPGETFISGKEKEVEEGAKTKKDKNG